MPAPVLYRSTHRVKVGQSFRFVIDYSPFESPEHYASKPPQSLWVRIRNTEPIPMRAAYLAGPYVLYVDCRPEEYNVHEKSFVTADQPVFDSQLLPGKAFYAELSCHTYRPKYRWTVDVVSQILFNNSIATNFDVCIATDKDMSHYSVPAPHLAVSVYDTLDLWNLPVPDTTKPLHLVILTHGLHSNVSADMMFLKEQIDSSQENVVVKGFFGNVCKTEKGIKYLGSRVAEYVVGLVRNETFSSVDKISFVGHSLGGLVQTFAIAYLQSNYPWFFEKIRPVNFVTLASPMLGVIHENPTYVKLALSAGVVGRTGQELGLQLTEVGKKPLLLLLASGITHKVLKRFMRRTVYANVVNDGIVPLRTSALLYLDYHGLSSLVGPGEKVAEDAKIPVDLPNNEDSQTSPLSSMLSFFMPQKQRDRYSRYQTNSSSTESGNSIERTLEEIPKPSMIESATSLILPPLPSTKYITDPDSRENVILHDKVYNEDDLPNLKEDGTKQQDQKKKGVIQMISDKRDEFRQLIEGNVSEHYEEEIAREYHKSMSWRKVLVKLKPDAHNNIVVRRRFANAYGWPVIEHLVENHFGLDEDTEPQTDETTMDEESSETDGTELTKILSRDVLERENEQLDMEPDDSTWIDSKVNGGGFVGPAGLLSEVSDMMYRFKEQVSNYGTSYSEEPVAVKESPTRLMGEFF
ncbi:putative lipase [Clavispora lusitaniae]|uniref:Lipase n=1 Tax=Clavispora lusitaniae TaxID=36911 RepID=A0AA91SZV2_CLALS|nr:putative lipase [Clavispora lusitaniae]